MIAPMDDCVVVRPSDAYEGKQALRYASGISGETAGSRSLCLTSGTIPPGGRSRAHLHRGIESAGYVIDGEVETLFGPVLERSVLARAGDFVYIPADVPHVVVNRSERPARVLVAHSAADDQEGVVLLPELDAVVVDPADPSGPPPRR
jgi:uncharacterized RmlC-like cupin family protein